MSELDDAKEFAELTEKNHKKSEYDYDNKPSESRAPAVTDSSKTEKKEQNPGMVTQYALYGNGYRSTTPTISSLPPGCYDISVDNQCVYVVPSIEPTGLLMQLPEMRSEDVIKIVETFWNSEKDYKEGNEFVIGGAAYKAGIMIYGPPGSGKSCTIKLLSKKLIQKGGTVFYADCHPNCTIGFLSDFYRIEKNRKSIVILEDFDDMVKTYGESGFLSMIDSAKSIDNVLFIATTNYPDRLDPRIYNRPGRFSHVVKIGLPVAAARTAYLKAILKNHRDIPYIVEHSNGFTIDHLTALINAVYREKKDLKNEIARLRTLFKVPTVEEKGSLGILEHD